MKNKKNYPIYAIMLAPGLLWLLLFNIVPMFGIVMAFQNFSPGLGIWRSEWVGLDNFEYMFQIQDSRSIFVNTIVISIGKMIGNLVFPLVFALLLNEVRLLRYKKAIQTIVYLPYFISWVILAGIMQDVFGYTGPVNDFFEALGNERIVFLGQADMFRQFVIGSDVWKNFGYNTIIFLAALTSIDPTLYEAAAIDGAGRWKRMLNVTLPGISIMIAMVAILSLGSVLNAGFDQIFNLYNPFVYSTGDIIDTWVYRTGIINLQFSLSTAVGLLKSVVGFIMITIGYTLAYKFANYRIF